MFRKNQGSVAANCLDCPVSLVPPASKRVNYRPRACPSSPLPFTGRCPAWEGLFSLVGAGVAACLRSRPLHFHHVFHALDLLGLASDESIILGPSGG